VGAARDRRSALTRTGVLMTRPWMRLIMAIKPVGWMIELIRGAESVSIG